MEKDLNPKILYIDSIYDGYVALKPIDGYYNTPVCIPQMYVFQFDKDLFEELRTKFDHGDKTELKRSWAKAVPLVQE
jgi:hypothetical protein